MTTTTNETDQEIIARLTADNADQATRLSRMTRKYVDENATVERLTSTNAELTRRNAELDNEADELVADSNKNINLLHDRNDELQVKLDVASEKLVLAAEREANQQQVITTGKNSESRLIAKLGQSTRENTELKKENQHLSKETHSSAIDIVELTNDNKELTKRNSILQAELDGEPTRRANFVKTALANAADNNSSIEDKKTISNLKNDKSNLEFDLSKLEAANTQLAESLENAASDFTRYEGIANEALQDAIHVCTVLKEAQKREVKLNEQVELANAKCAHVALILRDTTQTAAKDRKMAALARSVPAWSSEKYYLYMIGTETNWIDKSKQNTPYPAYMLLLPSGAGRMLFVFDDELLVVGGHTLEELTEPEQLEIRDHIKEFTSETINKRLDYSAQVAGEMVMKSALRPFTNESKRTLDDVAEFIEANMPPRDPVFAESVRACEVLFKKNRLVLQGGVHNTKRKTKRKKK